MKATGKILKADAPSIPLARERIPVRAPQIRTPHPGPKTRAHLERLRRAEGKPALSFGLSPEAVAMERGRGAAVEDVDGNLFLDFAGGFGSLNAGHSHPKIVAAACAQAEKLQQAMSVGSPPRTRLMEKVLSLVPGPAPKKMLMATSGSEAAEMAIKLARRATGRQEIVAFQGGFHGRTSGALALTARGEQRQGLGTLVPGAHHVPYPYLYRSTFGDDPAACVEGILRLIESYLENPMGGWGGVAAVIVEAVQGNGGMVPAPAGFLRGLHGLCARHGILLIADEVMSGFYRTGRAFAFEHDGVEPDLIVLGKSISGGFPLAACVAKEKIADDSGHRSEGTTYGGSPVSCAAGLAALEVYEEERLGERAEKMGAYFLKRLEELAERHPVIGEVRGRGLMVAAELVADRASREPLPLARDLSAAAVEKGLLFYPGGQYGNVLAFLPPLVIGEAEIDAAVGIIGELLPGAARS